MPADPDPDLDEFLATGPAGVPGLIPDVVLPSLFAAHGVARGLPSSNESVEVLRLITKATDACKRTDEIMAVEVSPRLRSVALSLNRARGIQQPLPVEEVGPLCDVLMAAIGWAEDPEAMASAAGMR